MSGPLKRVSLSSETKCGSHTRAARPRRLCRVGIPAARTLDPRVHPEQPRHWLGQEFFAGKPPSWPRHNCGRPTAPVPTHSLGRTDPAKPWSRPDEPWRAEQGPPPHLGGLLKYAEML